MKLIKIISMLLILLPSKMAFAYESKPCEILNNKLKFDITNEYAITVLCNQAYTSYYSDFDRIPYLVTENIYISNLTQKESRTNDFRPDMRLIPRFRAMLKDYYKSGYDRGHMSPAGNTNNKETISESFLLSNITPQNPELNRTLWKNIENYARIKANLNRRAYVITGVTFNHCYIEERLRGRVSVPDKFFKVILSGKDLDVFLVDNVYPKSTKINDYRITLNELNSKLCGIKISLVK